MARGSWGSPPRWAVVVMVVGGLLLAAGLPYALHTGRVSASEVPAAESPAPAVTATAARLTVPAHPQLLVFGDSYVQGIGADSPHTTFAHTAARLLGWPMTASGVGGTGYMNPGPAGKQTYIQRLPGLAPNPAPNIIVVEGGINDRSWDTAETDAAIAFVTALKAKFRGAQVVLLGPVDPDPPDANIDRISARIHGAALDLGIPFIDATGWITAQNIAQYTHGDHLHLNQAGHDYIGGRLAAAIRGLRQ